MMWNPNSDNKKAEDVSIAETTSDPRALNIIDNKSVAPELSNIAGKRNTTATTGDGESGSNRYSGSGAGGGGNVDCTADSSSISCSGGVDSGFLSGPQLSEDFDDHFDSGEGSGRGALQKIPSVQLNIIHKEHIVVDDYQDSGCIDEDPIDDEHYQSLKHKPQHKEKPLITTTAATPQTQQRNIIGTTEARNNNKSNNNTDDDDQMILDSGVDSGIAEWFCKLSVNDPNQQVNNLGAASQRQPRNVINQDANATYDWETYYQQDKEGNTQLHLACLMGRVDVVAALIRMAPDRRLFNIPNDEVNTCTHLAVSYGQPKILRMLLIAGAEPTSRDSNGNTPLHLACMFGDIQCVKALLIPISKSEINEAHRSYGHLSSDKTTSYLDNAHLPADLEIRNYDGERCVHLAAQRGHIEILKDLVWFGADINSREGKSGRTPLHIAIECRNEILINFLLEECSTLDLETATYAGLTAYQVACILNNSTIQTNLEQRGAEPLTPPDSDYDSSDIETDLDDLQMYDRFGNPQYFANYNGGNPINVA